MAVIWRASAMSTIPYSIRDGQLECHLDSANDSGFEPVFRLVTEPIARATAMRGSGRGIRTVKALV